MDALDQYGLEMMPGDQLGTYDVVRPDPELRNNYFVLAEGMSLEELTIYVKHLDSLTPEELDGWRPAPDVHIKLDPTTR